MNSFAGKTFKQSVPKTLKLSVKDQNGAAYSLVDGSIDMIVKAKKNDTDANAKFTVAATLTDAANGLAEIALSAANMNLPEGRYYYSILFTDAEDVPYVLEEDHFHIEKTLWETFP